MSWHTWRRDVDVNQLVAAINRAAPGEIRALRVSWRVREKCCETELYPQGATTRFPRHILSS
jgi:hypothetical protein